MSEMIAKIQRDYITENCCPELSENDNILTWIYH